MESFDRTIESIQSILRTLSVSLSKSQLKQILMDINHNWFSYTTNQFSRSFNNGVIINWNYKQGPNIILSLLQVFSDEANYAFNEPFSSKYLETIKQMCDDPYKFNLSKLSHYDVCQLHKINSEGTLIYHFGTIYRYLVFILLGILMFEQMVAIFKFPISEVVFIKKIVLGVIQSVLLFFYYKWNVMNALLQDFLKINTIGILQMNHGIFILAIVCLQLTTYWVFQSELIRLRNTQKEFPVSANIRALQIWGLCAFAVCGVVPLIVLIFIY
ncbi:uncharacterized protein SPAPADRAFT_152755 [Spathaspora passalidarum NRRL Y-27907]|uniref:Uncharacterized protein n=1 Tax=Spathaspora passalidarum (strain NRRL Y-27907 / 11-Y1) TaxID=619300 RepID=G3APL1_SPAPN|nr:uncharacterized protein SPAPADRAFT_152755 [Spathaspora passalidarum NRRL Y-27907]EGW32182.1 hypothetical protein SPAPADRAFT_152755 [Spathaspora passalidarum NRRL Y-27907]